MAGDRDHFTAAEAMGFLGRRYRATRAVTQGRRRTPSGARWGPTRRAPTVSSSGWTWCGKACPARSPVDDRLGGRSYGFNRRDMFLVLTGGERR